MIPLIVLYKPMKLKLYNSNAMGYFLIFENVSATVFSIVKSMFIDFIALISTSLNIGFFTLRYYFTQNFTANTPVLSVL